METENNKPWKRPWSAKEIAENANNWSLAADVGLLKHLEQFADVSTLVLISWNFPNTFCSRTYWANASKRTQTLKNNSINCKTCLCR